MITLELTLDFATRLADRGLLEKYVLEASRWRNILEKQGHDTTWHFGTKVHSSPGDINLHHAGVELNDMFSQQDNRFYER